LQQLIELINVVAEMEEGLRCLLLDDDQVFRYKFHDSSPVRAVESQSA
jgi:hypothetical protein